MTREATIAAGTTQLTDARKVYILPTRFGLLFAAALLLMLLVSVNYNNGLGHLFTFLLAGIGIVAMHYTQRNLLDLAVGVEPGKPVFLGDTARARVLLEDRAQRPRSAVTIRGDGGEVVVDVDAGGFRRADLPFAPSRRGLVRVPDVYCVSIFPLGLFCAWTRTVRGDSEQLVYPRPAAPGPLPKQPDGDPGSGSAARQGDDDFHGIRDHRRGDSPSRIHWRNSARGAGLKTKQFDGEGSSTIELDWNMTSGDVETRLSLLCRWLLDAEATGRNYGLALPQGRIPPGRGGDHLQRCLRSLALWPG